MNFVMKNSFKLILCVLLVAGLGLSGCAKPTPPIIAKPVPPTPQPQKAPEKEKETRPTTEVSRPLGVTDLEWKTTDKVAKQVGVRDVFFDYNRYTIRSDMRAVLKANAKALNADPNKRVVVEGHCDERGTEEYNIALGDRRAEAIKKYLKNLGISSSRITTTSFGEQKPFCKSHNETCWQQNRRGHFVIR